MSWIERSFSILTGRREGSTRPRTLSAAERGIPSSSSARTSSQSNDPSEKPPFPPSFPQPTTVPFLGPLPAYPKAFVDDIPPDFTTSPDAPIWGMYNVEAGEFDRALIEGWTQTLDVFLIFTGLFSAVLTAFLVLSYSLLQPDNVQATINALTTISNQLLTSQVPTHQNVPYQPEEFVIPASALWINALWFLSLFTTLCTSICAMLVKQWLRAYPASLPLRTRDKACERQSRYDGLLVYAVPSVINFLPILVHAAVFMFLGGLVPFLWMSSGLLGAMMCGLVGSAGAVYLACSVLPLFEPRCPYKSSLTTVIGDVGEFLKDVLPWRRSRAASAENVRAEESDAEVDALLWLAKTTLNTEQAELALLGIAARPPVQGYTKPVLDVLVPTAASVLNRSLLELNELSKLRPDDDYTDRGHAVTTLGTFLVLVDYIRSRSGPYRSQDYLEDVYKAFRSSNFVAPEIFNVIADMHHPPHQREHTWKSLLVCFQSATPPLPIVSLCLAMAHISQFGKDEHKEEMLDAVAELVLPNLAQCTNVPGPLMATVYCLMHRWTESRFLDELCRDSFPHPASVPQGTCYVPPKPFFHSTIQNLNRASNAVRNQTIVEQILSCVINNREAFYSTWGLHGLFPVLQRWLKHYPHTSTSRPSLEALMQALTVLIDRIPSSSSLPSGGVHLGHFLDLAEISNPALGRAIHVHTSGTLEELVRSRKNGTPASEPIWNALRERGAIGELCRQAHAEDAWSCANAAVRVFLNESSRDASALSREVRQSNFLGAVLNIHLPRLRERTNSFDLSELIGCLRKLVRLDDDIQFAVVRSGIWAELQNIVSRERSHVTSSEDYTQLEHEIGALEAKFDEEYIVGSDDKPDEQEVNDEAAYRTDVKRSETSKTLVGEENILASEPEATKHLPMLSPTVAHLPDLLDSVED